MSDKIKRIQLPTHEDERGKLSVIELKDYVDWPVKRVYYVTDTKKDRGGHAVRGEKKMYVCMQGTMLARIHDGKEWHEFQLEGPSDALIMNEMCWREFTGFSEGAVLMAISSMNYEPDTYIFDMEEFLEEVKNTAKIRDEKTLKAAAKEIVQYEIDEFRRAVSEINAGFDPQRANQLTESLALHAVNLYDFFYRKRKEDDDLIADDFIEDGFHSNKTPKKDLKILVHKRIQLCHLSLKRLEFTGESKSWKEELASNMEKTILAFRDSLPERRKDWFKI